MAYSASTGKLLETARYSADGVRLPQVIADE